MFDTLFSVLAPAVVVGFLLILLLARQLWRGGRLPLHDAPALRSQFTFQGREDEPEQALLAQLGSEFERERTVRLGAMVLKESYAFAELLAPGGGFRVSLGLMEERWLGFVSHGPGGLAPPPDSAEARAVLTAVHAALNAMPGVREVRWHKYEALTREDETTAAATPLG